MRTTTMSDSDMRKDAKIFIAGHQGLVGSAIFRRLEDLGYTNLLVKTRQELDLTRQDDTDNFLNSEKPDLVVLAAAKVGGIHANNTYPAEFIRDNLAIQTNVIHSAYLAGVKRLLFLGSSCIYPKLASQPISEEALLTGPLEPTNEPYALAKIAGLSMCSSYNRQYGTRYFAAMPTNLYGPNDNFDLQNSHVLPALIRRFHDARVNGDSEVIVWGTGAPRREFLFVDDMAAACVFLMEQTDAAMDQLMAETAGRGFVNVGCGEDVSIRELAETVAQVVGFTGELVFDTSKPDGTPRKLLDVSQLKKMGWEPKVPLKEGIEKTYRWFLSEFNG